MSSSICQWDQIGTRELAAIAPLAATAGTPASRNSGFLQQAAGDHVDKDCPNSACAPCHAACECAAAGTPCYLQNVLVSQLDAMLSRPVKLLAGPMTRVDDRNSCSRCPIDKQPSLVGESQSQKRGCVSFRGPDSSSMSESKKICSNKKAAPSCIRCHPGLPSATRACRMCLTTRCWPIRQ